MRHATSAGMLAAGLLVLAPAARAQVAAQTVGGAASVASVAQPACGAWSLWALRGTYSFTATAWQDLSQINPGLPAGYAPVTIVGTFSLDGLGELTGRALINAGGLPLTAEFVDSRFSVPGPDCVIPITLSMRIGEFGDVVTGPYPYVGVVVSDRPALEVAFMMLGAGPGSHVELDHAKRISMSY